MDTIIEWFRTFLSAGLPTAVVGSIFGLGVLVSAVVAFIRTQWSACSGKMAILTVFVVSAVLNLFVFLGAGLLDSAHVVYYFAAVGMVALSAIGGNQVLTKGIGSK